MKLVLTSGDINGIGPEISIKALNRLITSDGNTKYILTTPANAFQEAAALTKPSFSSEVIERREDITDDPSVVTIFNIGSARRTPGLPTKESGRASALSIQEAFELVDKGYADGMVTAPISKHAMYLGGFDYPGHTEMLAQWSGTVNFLMMFLSDAMKAALTTIHIPISQVPLYVKEASLTAKLRVLIDSLKDDFGIKKPKISVLGLNPHAGEDGVIGDEEIRTIAPALKQFSACVEGPFVPDAFFARKAYLEYDAVLGMYHDQVLIPFKMLDEGKGVNYTAGLPFVRTSPDHGTAYDIAGTGKASAESMIAAIHAAKTIINNRALFSHET